MKPTILGLRPQSVGSTHPTPAPPPVLQSRRVGESPPSATGTGRDDWTGAWWAFAHPTSPPHPHATFPQMAFDSNPFFQRVGDAIGGSSDDMLPFLVVGIIALGLAAQLIAALRKPERRHRRSERSQPRWTPNLRSVSTGDPQADTAARQMAAVAAADFSLRPILNKSEHRLFLALERVVRDMPGHRLFAQIALGEVIGSDTDDGYRAVSAKRLDFAIVDRSGRLARAIEYQGRGHYDSKTYMRDAVKREALRKAGIALIEVPAEWSEDGLRRLVLDVPEAGRTVRRS